LAGSRGIICGADGGDFVSFRHLGKIGLIADSLGAASLDQLLGTAAELGIESAEFHGDWNYII
jgi:hypothetical protein